MHHRQASPYPGLDKVAGSLPVNSARKYYQPKKADIVANDLIVNQCSSAEKPTKDVGVIASSSINMLIGITTKLSSEDLETWRQAYKKDPRLQTIFQKLR